MKTGFHLFLFSCLLLAVATASPDRVFLGADVRIPEEPLRFWGGKTAELEILSHLQLQDPDLFVLSKALAAPLRLEAMSRQASQPEEGLNLYRLTFIAPEPRMRQRYLMRFGADGPSLLFDVYPLWQRQQVAQKAAAYEIQLDSKRSGVKSFLDSFEFKEDSGKQRPILKIVHSDYEQVICVSSDKIILKTDCDALNAMDPLNTQRFEALLDTLKQTTTDDYE